MRSPILETGRARALAGRKVMTLVSAMCLGAVGTFLRAFTFGHVRQLDRVLAQRLVRTWSAGARRRAAGGQRRPFAGEVYGYVEQGAGYGL